ncbi:hypothetical protein DL98DRAFT_272545 [Cadophora sp. DSE1049]|nr:hypothetical protein DL98DRAFT_272545 [Cadophora sp. DSE1049]
MVLLPHPIPTTERKKMHLLINLLITLLPLPLTHATTLTLQLGGQTTSFSSGSSSVSTHDFNQSSLGLSDAGATYPITTCGCTSLEDKQSMCAHIVYDGQLVRFYSSVGCTGRPVSWEFDGADLGSGSGSGLEGEGGGVVVGEAWTCGFWTWSSGSLGVGCAEI